jgi:serine/threonine-protein kinase
VSAHLEQTGFVGRVLGGRWLVGDQLGSGSFGVVHAGVERATGAPVAVKLLHPQFIHHGETIARFWNEAEALRRLDHPNVLVLLDAGVCEDGVPWLVTELLTGETLRQLLDREGPLPPERAMRLLGPAAHALHHAHLAGILHRDLKPENIFRVRKDGLGTTKILDFGMAKLLDTPPGKKLSQTGVLIGTMAYSPPEQMQGVQDLDARADQFGFAALMFEALTGQRPFPQSQPFALFQAIMSGPRPRASDLRPGIPEAVDEVLLRGLDADRARRFASVEEFYLALTSAFAGQPIPIAPAPPAVTAPPPAAPPPVPQEQHEGPSTLSSPPLASARYRAISDEATKVRQAPPDLARPANLNTTLASVPMPGRAPVSGTLLEGTAPDYDPGSHASTSMRAASPLTSSVPPPGSGQPGSIAPPFVPPPRYDSVRPPPSGGAAPQEPKAKSSMPWLIVLVVAVIVIALVAFFAGRASSGRSGRAPSCGAASVSLIA